MCSGADSPTGESDSYEVTDDADSPSPARPYTSGLLIRPDMGTYPREFRAPLGLRPRPQVVLVVWGVDAACAALALHQGRSYAQEFGFPVRESFAGYGGRMRESPLVGIALRHFERRYVTYGLGWWLVRHSAVSPRDRDNARTALRQAWTQDAAEAGEFHTARVEEHGPQSLRPVVNGGWIHGRRL